jgi:hypothetical protein
MGKISWFKKYKYADPAPYSCEDQELLLRSYLNSKFESVNQIVLAYRIKNSISFLRILRVRWSLFKVSLLSFYRKKNLFFIAALFFVFFIKLFRDLFAIKLYSSSILSEDLNVFNKVLYLNEK